MSEALFSPSWYRVATLSPRLRSHAQLHRHQYRGQTWYVLQDRSNERYHRFSPSAYAFIGLMDGKRTVQEIWDLVSTKLGDDAPTQPEVVQLLSQLHSTDVLQCDIPPDIAELLHRHERTRQKKWQRKLMNVFAWQFPLFDPERLLQTFVSLVRPFFGWGGAALWLAIVIPGLLVGATHWSDLTANLIDQITTPQNLVLLWFLFPIIKALHEFGHAFAVKAFGGEVHEMGIMLLVFSPVPYVDASASSAFSSKWQRAVVGAAGMIVELMIASIAILVWVSVEPGLVSTLAYNTVMIAGISTVIFNGNPLLRFDGYHMLADLTEIPNLGQRGNKYLGYLCERYPFGRTEAQVPHATPGERVWFVGYAVSAFLYRVFIVFVILMYLTDQWFALGMFFAAVTAITWFLIPLGKGFGYLFTGPRLRRVRGRAIAVTAGAVAVVIVALCLTPVPFRTRAEGVVWIPDEAVVRAGADGFVEQVVGIPGSKVSQGDVLVVCRDSVLTTQLTVLQAQVQEIDARIREHIPTNLVKAKILEEEKRYIEEKLARTRERVRDLVITAKVDGTLVVSRVEDLPGRFVHRGDVLAHVVDLKTLTVRTVVDQTDIDLIRHSTKQVQVRLAERIVSPIDAGVTRLVPAASDELPSPALGSAGGGQVPIDPKDPKGQKALRKVFQMDLQLPVDLGVVNVGGRVYVRFDHGWVPLMAQWFRQGRQLFLSRFNV
ncbi:MAG: HlyD family efflux transporter periplasmic adaptor subunit [Nitrospira sp. CG24E]|nr:MAG: HlyD family efflux transporter periplasmic adaptor subunit [Nitrospira sp. CG24E]